MTASLSIAWLLPALGSVTPAGGATLALLDTVPLKAVTSATTVKVTLPPEGKMGIAIPDCNCATLVDTGHWAPPVAMAQFTLDLASPATAASVRMAPFAACGPALPTTME